MIIDTHCHFDMMPNPELYISQGEARGDTIIGMTNLPSHFQQGVGHVQGYKHIRLSLGFHPQMVGFADTTRELELFSKQLGKTSYIGEIGLDFSKEYAHTKELQLTCLKRILELIQGEKKIVSVHSRLAETELFTLLQDYDIHNVIFHWYSGKLSLIPQILEAGYFFSINEAMTLSENGKRIISRIPVECMLTESDAPYNKKHNITSALNAIGVTEAVIRQNFNTLIDRIRMN